MPSAIVPLGQELELDENLLTSGGLPILSFEVTDVIDDTET